MKVVLLVLALTLPLSASADRPDSLLKQGIAYYNLAQFDASLKALDRAMATTKDVKNLGKISLYIGLNRAVMGDQNEARKHFRRALISDSSLTLDPSRFKKELIVLFNQVRGALKGRLTVRLKSDGVTVFVDGKNRGEIPLTLDLAAGKHRVNVRSKDGLTSYSADVQISPDGRADVQAVMEPNRGQIELKTRPSGVEVLLDGENVGKTPLDVQVNAGKHLLVLQRAGYSPVTRMITVEPGKAASIKVRLKKAVADTTGAPETSFFGNRTWTWVAAGSAVAILGVGIGVGYSAWYDREDPGGGWKARNCHDPYDHDEGGAQCGDIAQTIQSKMIAANVMFGLAGALAVTSAVLYFLEGRGAGSPESPGASRGAKLLPTVSADGVGGVVTLPF